MYYVGAIPCYASDELAHFGVKGMKWGVRRYQNEDGSLTDAGKKKYYVAENGKIKKKSLYDRTFDKTYDKTMKRSQTSSVHPLKSAWKSDMVETGKLLGKFALTGAATVAVASISPKHNKLALAGMLAADVIVAARTDIRMDAKRAGITKAYQDDAARKARLNR